MKILFYVEPLIELNRPQWKEAWANYFSLTIMDSLATSSKGGEMQFMIGLNAPLAELFVGEDRAKVVIFSQEELLKPFQGGYKEATSKWFKETYSEEELNYYCKLIHGKFDGFTPDIIITFSPAPFFRKAFPNALLLHQEYGIFSRPPFPKTWYFDPITLFFGNSILNRYGNEFANQNLNDAQINAIYELKNTIKTLLKQRNPFKQAMHRDRKRFKKTVLLPLQFSDYYAFDATTWFTSQDEYLTYVLEHCPTDIGIVVTTHPEYSILNQSKVDNLKKRYHNLIWHHEFDDFYASSQYILSEVDAVISVSSTVALQTLLWDNKLLSLNNGFLKPITDSYDIKDLSKILTMQNKTEAKDRILYWLLTYYAVPENYIKKPEWLLHYFEQYLHNFNQGKQGVELLPLIDDGITRAMDIAQSLDISIPHKNHMASLGMQVALPIISSQLVKSKRWATSLNNAVATKDEQIRLNQEHIERLSKWGQSLDSTIKDKDIIIINQNMRIEELSQWGQTLDADIEKYGRLITSLNEEILKLGTWGRGLDAEIDRKNELLKTKDELLKTKDEHLRTKDAQLNEQGAQFLEQAEQLDALRKQLELHLQHENELQTDLTQEKTLKNELNALVLKHKEDIERNTLVLLEMDSKIQELNSKTAEMGEIVRNQQGHIEQLLVKERHLDNILSSNGWKMLLRYYKVRDFILPEGSLRRLFVKGTFKLIVKPSRIKHLTPSNLKKFWYFLGTEDPSMTETRIDAYMQRSTNATPLRIDSPVPTDTVSVRKLVFPKLSALSAQLSAVSTQPSTPDDGSPDRGAGRLPGAGAPGEASLTSFSAPPRGAQEVPGPLVSIIIPVHNNWPYTYACLEAILANTEGIAYEVIIADDNSTDETRGIAKHVENIKIIRNTEPLRFVRNCNKAAKEASGKYILFLNNDTAVQKDWLKWMLELAENDAKVGVVGSKLVFPDGRLQEAGGIIWKDASGWNYGRLDDPNKPEYNYVKECDYVSGACLMVRRALWEDIGGFDERYAPAYYEDADLAFEARRKGYKVFYQPKSVVVHFEGISHGTDITAGMKSYQVDNKAKFQDKWEQVLKGKHFDNGQNIFHARDRSYGKKTILVIDHYVPQYDKDAGSRTTFQYLKLFREMGMNVKFLGDNFFKHEPYSSELEQLGVEILYGVWFRDNWKKWLEENGRALDIVYLQRPYITKNYIDHIKRFSKAKIWYNSIDFHYIREARQYNITKNKEHLKKSHEFKKLEFSIFEKSDWVITISEYERFVLSKKLPSKNCAVIPTFIFENIPIGINADIKDRTDITFVGNFVHNPNVDGVKWFVNDVLPKINAKLPNIRVNVIGGNAPKDVTDLQSQYVNITGFISDSELSCYYARTRVIIAPLRFGAGVKGKIIEAIAHGIPLVTTQVGIEGIKDIADEACMADTPEGFSECVISLFESDERWKEMRKVQLTYAKKNMSMAYAKQVIETISRS